MDIEYGVELRSSRKKGDKVKGSEVLGLNLPPDSEWIVDDRWSVRTGYAGRKTFYTIRLIDNS